MAATLEVSRKTAKSASKWLIYKRSITVERMKGEYERIDDLTKEVCQWLSQILDVQITSKNSICTHEYITCTQPSRTP